MPELPLTRRGSRAGVPYPTKLAELERQVHGREADRANYESWLLQFHHESRRFSPS